jgi:peptidyl-prolyl cis-trans isomerase C
MRSVSENRRRQLRRCCVRRLLIWPLLLVLMCAGGAQAVDSAAPVARAALVNGTEITVRDFQRELERITRRQGFDATSGDAQRLAELKREVLDNLITRELLYQESVRQKITMDASTVDREMEQVKGRFSDPGQFTVNLQRSDMTEAMVREQVARGLAIRTLIERSVARGVVVTDQDLDRYYQQQGESFRQPAQVRLGHILIAVDSAWPSYNVQEATDRLSAIHTRLVKGEDFAVLARSHSDCQSKTRGGDLGWFEQGQLTPEVEQVVAGLKVDGISGIVKDRFGLHLLKVTDHRPAYIPPLDEIREKVRSRARQEKAQAALDGYVKRLRDAAAIETFLTVE